MPHATDPGRVTLPVSGTALPTGDHQMETPDVEFVDRPEQGFGADEADGRRQLA
jgi:hypothetical protein